jgi:dolichol-phosphate hexosyltransferase
MADRDDVCVLIPTLDEAETIGDVVEGFREHGFTNVLVVDGDSGDGTREIAAEHGARVIVQSSDGKGQAVREAIERIEAPYVLMVDGDGTYRPEDADAMLEPLVSGEYEHVIGNRFADMADGAMSRVNHAGNRLINWAFALMHGPDLHDILSGYRAFTRESIERMTLSATGFGIETEMAVECVKRDVSTGVVPIRYEPRPDGSETNLRPLRDGSIIVLTLYQLARTNNPLFYFGSVGLSTMLLGAFVASYVGYRWFVHGVGHEVLALVAGVAILLGFQIVMFGLLSDLIVTLHREQMRRFEEERER